MTSQGFLLPLRICVLYFLLLLFCISNDKFKSGVSCSETLHSNGSDFEANDHLQMVTSAPTSFILALQWPPSMCMSKTCDADKYPVPRRFTIHGLWPNTGATNCNPKDTLDYLKLSKATRDRLDIAWPGLLRNSGGQQQFLGHEWSKHGTCSGLTQKDYFERALDLRDGVNVQNRLADCGRDSQDKPISFVPGAKNKYNPSDIITAYENKWKLRIKIKCLKKRGSTQGEEVIGEIHFRANKDAKIVESITGPTTEGCTKTSVSFPDKFP